MLSSQDKYIARILFKLKIHSSKGQAYEDFFCDIMEKKDGNFARVKPQGQFGDRKNDGFNKISGEYYQVYAPENPLKNTSKAVRKLEEDFKGLYKHWQKISPIKHFFFTFNDKYTGTFPELEQKLSEMAKSYKGIKFYRFLVNNLEDIFMEFDLRSKKRTRVKLHMSSFLELKWADVAQG